MRFTGVVLESQVRAIQRQISVELVPKLFKSIRRGRHLCNQCTHGVANEAYSRRFSPLNVKQSYMLLDLLGQPFSLYINVRERVVGIAASHQPTNAHFVVESGALYPRAKQTKVAR